MSKIKRAGILLIIVGIFIPLVLLPITSLNESAIIRTGKFARKGVAYNKSINDLEVALVEGEWDSVDGGYDNRKAIPYEYIFMFGTTLVFIGAILFTQSRNKPF